MGSKRGSSSGKAKEKKTNKKFLLKCVFYFIVAGIPCIILGTTLWMILSRKWLTDAMGFCINTIMVVSSWMIVVFETSARLSPRGQSSGKDNDFKIVDCMTIIFTVITICYSFLQICNPPIGFSQIMKLILWFSAIIAYTIWIKPTRLKVLCMCLVATLITTLFIMPATYQEYYEQVIEECKWESYPVGNEEIYDLKSQKYGLFERTKNSEGLSGFETLMQDGFFRKNYHETLYPLAKRYIEDRENGGVSAGFDVNYGYDLKNLKTPNVYIWSSKPFFYRLNLSSLGPELAAIRTERIAEVGFEAERIIGADGNRVWIQYDHMKGLSGYKNITFLKGFAAGVNGEESAEKPSVDFCFWGYDILIWAVVMLAMLCFATGFVLDERNVARKVKTRYTVLSAVAVGLAVIYVIGLIV